MKFKATLITCFGLLFFVACWSVSFAQQNQYDKATPPQHAAGVSPLGSYTSVDFGTVNLSNGSLSLKFPIGSVGGRGFQLPLTLNWNSKLWSGSTDTDEDQDGSIKTVAFADFGRSDDFVSFFNRVEPGWTVGFAPTLVARIVRINFTNLQPQGPCYHFTLPKLTLILPDKGEIEFRDDAYDGMPLASDCGGYLSASRGRRWHATDGSGMIFINDVNDGVASYNTSGVVITADGMRYHFTGELCDSITDRNGNQITFHYNGYDVEITDQLGRVTLVQHNVADPQNPAITLGLLVTLPGYGQSRYYKIKGGAMNQHYRSDTSPTLPVITGDYDPLSNGYGWGTATRLFELSYGRYAQRIDNRSVVTELVLPDNRSVHFRYNEYGEVAEVETPTGGKVWYDYDYVGDFAAGESPVWETGGDLHTRVFVDRGVLTRRTFPDGVNLECTWNYWYGTVSGFTAMSATSELLLDERHYFSTGGRYYFYPNSNTGIPDGTQNTLWSTGVEYRSETRNAAGAVIAATENDWTQRAPMSWSSYPQEQLANDNRVNQTRRYLDTGAFAKIETDYDNANYPRANNVSEVRGYDFDGTLKRRSTTSYVTGSYQSDDAIHLVSLPATQTIYSTADNSGKAAEVVYDYDNYTDEGPNGNHAALTDYATVTQHDSAYGTGKITRGNVTSVGGWLNTAGAYIYSYSRYDILGNVVSAKGPNDIGTTRVTTISFSDDFGNGSNPGGGSQGTNGPTYALPTLITSPPPQPGQPQHTARTQYDFATGLLTGFKDRNGIITQTFYDDPFNRPTLVKSALGVSGLEAHAAVYYAPATVFGITLNNNDVLMAKDQSNLDDGVLRSWTRTDGFGRTVESWSRDPQGDVKVHTIYDPLGRVKQVSNPYRPSLGEMAIYTTTVYDLAGRVTSVTTPDNAVVSTSYSANIVTVTDQAGKQRKSVTDALGRLTQVYEAPNDANYNYLTSYSYDTLDNLTTVTQGSQTRGFVYDSLKRLTSAANPESGAVSYSYDNNGNLLTKTDARNITTNFVYDALNRVISRSYSDGTPAVTYAYDSDTIANGKGRLASVSSSVSSYSYSGYDALGRALGGSETIGTQIYSMSYSFDLAGHMKTMTYPSGHSITNGFDNAGRLSSFTGNLGDGTQRTYATGINYSPLGGTTIEQFGTQTSLYHKLQYNVRGQLWDVRVSTAPDVNGSWNRGCLQFFYDSAGGFGTSGPDNNGNVLKSWHYIPMDEQYSGWAIQRDSYSYDSLNRIASVTETYVSNTEAENPKFVQAYTYDRYGNRTINTGATWGVGINNTAFEIDPLGNNQLLAPGDASLAPFSRRVQYDQAGNLKTDTYTGQGTRTYDAENRMTEAQASAPASYSYDGDGHRIKRNVNGTETWQVYGLGGELIGEYAANAAPMSPQEEYGYRNGQLLITASATSGWGAAPTFNDNPLVVNQTIAKAQHITELRTAINAVRSHYNLSAYAWQYSATTNDYISANPILEMRTALDQALGAPSGGYSAGLAIGQSIKAIHIQELRDRILAAWQSGGGVDIRWLVTDQLGTPRMVFDQTGSLANVSRHDYLPFGEELFAGTGGRTTQQGYSASDGVRQHFTQKERDGETGLDYFLARYYSSTQGRFTSADPENAGADSEDPQSWNGYGYARSSPLVYSDPDGREYLVCDPDGGNCRTVSDNDFYAERKAFEKTGNVYTGNRDFFESGEIKNAEGGIVATYVQISIDDPVREFIFEMRRQTAPIPEATLKFFKLSVELGVPGGVVKYVRGPSAITSLGLEAGAAAETATIGGRTVTLVGRGLQNVRTVGSGRLAGATLEVIRHSQGETKRLERHFVN